MLSVKELSIVYEALLAPETMSTPVKITLNITRKQALLLAKVIELGLAVEHESGQSGIWSVVDGSELGKLQGLAADLLKKAGLTEMMDKLNALTAKRSVWIGTCYRTGPPCKKDTTPGSTVMTPRGSHSAKWKWCSISKPGPGGSSRSIVILPGRAPAKSLC